MWIFTPFGFFSVVHKTHDAPDRLTIRITAEKDDLAYLMARLIGDLDYDNFKNEVAKQQGHERAARYGEVWSTLYELQLTEAA